MATRTRSKNRSESTTSSSAKLNVTLTELEQAIHSWEGLNETHIEAPTVRPSHSPLSPDLIRKLKQQLAILD